MLQIYHFVALFFFSFSAWKVSFPLDDKQLCRLLTAKFACITLYSNYRLRPLEYCTTVAIASIVIKQPVNITNSQPRLSNFSFYGAPIPRHCPVFVYCQRVWIFRAFRCFIGRRSPNWPSTGYSSTCMRWIFMTLLSLSLLASCSPPCVR